MAVVGIDRKLPEHIIEEVRKCVIQEIKSH